MSNQLLFNYPKIEIYCEPHVSKLLNRFLKQNGNQVLNTKHWYGALLKRLLQKHNPNWDYSSLCRHYTAKFIIEISESEMQKYGSMLSPANTKLFNNTVDSAFEFSMYHQVSLYRAMGDTEKDATYKALAWHGLTEDDYSYEAAHMAVYRYNEQYNLV